LVVSAGFIFWPMTGEFILLMSFLCVLGSRGTIEARRQLLCIALAIGILVAWTLPFVLLDAINPVVTPPLGLWSEAYDDALYLHSVITMKFQFDWVVLSILGVSFFYKKYREA
jgi:hypothetical protein